MRRVYSHHAFISFNSADRPLARRLRRALRGVASHTLGRHRLRVFLDESSLPIGVPLSDKLRRELTDSARLILIASHASATAPWVRQEVAYWQATRAEPILLVHAGDRMTWSDGDFDWDHTDALDANLFRGAYPAAPLWADLRSPRGRRLRGAGEIRRAAVKLTAGILGMDADELWRSEVRRRRGRAAVAVVVAAAAITGPTLAVRYQGEATAANRLTVVQQLLANADEHTGRLDTTLLLTAAAYRLAPDSLARDRLLEYATASPGLREIPLMPAAGAGTVGSVAFSPDGRLLAGAASTPTDASSSATALIWPADGRGAAASVAVSAASAATSLAFGPDSRRLAVGDADGAVTVITLRAGNTWPPASRGRLTLAPPGPAEQGQPVARLSFSPDGHRLAASYHDGRSAIWDLTSRQIVASFAGTVTAFAPSGGTLASIAPTAELVLRDAATFRIIATFGAGVPGPADLAYRPDGRAIAITSGLITVSGTESAIAIADVATRTSQTIAETVAAGQVAYGPGDEIATDSELVEAAGSPNPLVLARVPNMLVSSIAFDPAGGDVVYGGSWKNGQTGAVMLFAPRPTTALPTASLPAPAWLTSAVSPDGRTLAVTDASGAVTRVSAVTGRPAGPPLRGGVAAATTLAFSRDGRLLAGLNGRQVTIWTLADGTAHDVFLPVDTPGGEASGLAFSPDGSTLAVVTPDGRVLLVSVAHPTAAAPALATGPACDVAFSPDGGRLAVATPGGAQLWDTGTGRRVALFPSASGAPGVGPVTCTGTVAVGFALGGTALVAAAGSTLTVTRLDSGRTTRLPVPVFSPLSYYVANYDWDVYSHLAISPDGDLVAAGSTGGAVFLWDLTDLRQVGPMLLPGGQVSGVAFVAGGDSVMSLGGATTTWNLSPAYWLAWTCRTVQRDLTAAEWDQFGVGPRIEECAP